MKRDRGVGTGLISKEARRFLAEQLHTVADKIADRTAPREAVDRAIREGSCLALDAIRLLRDRGRIPQC